MITEQPLRHGTAPSRVCPQPLIRAVKLTVIDTASDLVLTICQLGLFPFSCIQTRRALRDQPACFYEFSLFLTRERGR
jgi:hypothetical protein